LCCIQLEALLFRILLLAFLVSCVPGAKQSVTSGAAANPNAPSRWPLGVFPKTMKFSNQFTTAELDELQDAAVSWTTHAGAGTTFISSSKAPGSLVADRSGVANLDSLLDGVFAVYKATTWNSALPDSALAVTQIFGVRHNAGDSDEYVEIVEGDILVNYDDFPFLPESSGGYDLFTVMIHENGHFLGLNHNYNFNSVMYPSIGYSTFYLRPGSFDISTIQSKYGLGGGGAGPAAARRIASVETASLKDDVLKSGKGVRITLELHAHGECVHKVDGTRVGSHPVKLK
jgi:hypothetical protein